MKNKRLWAGCLCLVLLLSGLCAWRNTLVKAEAKEIEVIATMDSKTMLCGEEEVGSIVDIAVYLPLDQRNRILLFSTRLTVGESGLYQVSVPLPLIGEQYVAVTVNNVTTQTCYVRYSQNTADELSEKYLNVYEFLLGGVRR